MLSIYALSPHLLALTQFLAFSPLPDSLVNMSTDGKDDAIISDIRSLEKQVIQSLENVNSIASILKHLRSDSDAIVFQAIKSCQRIFIHYQTIKEFTHHGVSSNATTNKKLNKKKEDSKNEALAEDPKHQVRVWLRKRYFEYCSRLVELLSHEEPGLQLPALEALMSFERIAGRTLAGEGELPKFANVFLPLIVAVLVHNGENTEELMEEFRKKYLTVFDDVRLFLLKALAQLIEAYNPLEAPQHGEYYGKKPFELKLPKRTPYLLQKEAEFNEAVFNLLISINMAAKPEDLNNFLVQLNDNTNGDHKNGQSNSKKRKRAQDEDDDEDDFDMDLDDEDDDEDDEEQDAPLVNSKLLELDAHKAAFSKAWLTMMAKKLDTKLHIRVLQALEKQILPFMINPVALYDYLSHCYQSGGVIGMLSLGGLFVLLRKFNVEYPDFFPQLYSMITPSTFFVKQRKRFFELSALFLEGATLPLYMICAFLKRFSRLSLTASPQACLILISMTYRILIKHPAAQVLLHRTHSYTANGDGENGDTGMQTPLMLSTRLSPLANDPYNMDEHEPSKCNAIESSLWEMKLLSNHAVPAVATLAQLLFGSPELKLLSVNINDFIEQSYQSLFDSEHKRKTKNSALNFQLPKRLWDKQLFSAYTLNPVENMVGFHDPQLVAQIGPTSTAAFQEKKKRKSFSELKDDRKKKKAQFGNKRPRFRMK